MPSDTVSNVAPKRPSLKHLIVRKKNLITPHMMRITFGGPELAGFSTESEGGYIKLFLGDVGSDVAPFVRTYTVRKYDSDNNEIDVDFVVHDTDGPAVSWAKSCQIGDMLSVGGPGAKKAPKADADWVLFSGDMSALPAISAHLEAMDRNAKGYAIIEILSAEDEQSIDAPENVDVQWLINSQPEQDNSVLFDRVKSLSWLDGQAYIWIAGELGQSLAIRGYMKKERGISRHQMYASSYWQIGSTEDGHKIAKREAQDY